MTYTEVTANPAIAADTFAVADEVKAKARAAASSDVPYQWVLRRMFLGRFLDSDAVYFLPGGGFKLVELSPNVQQVVGGGANNLIVAMKDGIVVFDAPMSDVQSRWVIDAAKAKYPGKPIKNLVLTHHHMDHTGGMRTYVAEGANVIVPAPTKAYFEQVARAAAHGRARHAAEAGEAGADRRSEGHDVAEGRHGRDQPAQHPEPAFRRDDPRSRGRRPTSYGSPTSGRLGATRRARRAFWRCTKR